MTSLVLLDAMSHPGVFHWHGPVPHDQLLHWLNDTGYLVPSQLLEVWETLGAGDLFETETILAPCDAEDNIDDNNEWLTAQGLPSYVLAFHRGLCVSGIDQGSGDILELDPQSLRETRRYKTFDEWYVEALRKEFAERYGLPQLRS